MTRQQKSALVHFITRPGMYISPLDKNSFVSFVHGFEAAIVTGTASDYPFTSLLKRYLEEAFSINGGASGWPHQVEIYARKQSIPWETAFRRIALCVLFSKEAGKRNRQMEAFVRSRIHGKIDRIEATGWFNESWREDWNSIGVGSPWVGKLYTKAALEMLRQMDAEINAVQAVPSQKLLELKKEWLAVQS